MAHLQTLFQASCGTQNLSLDVAQDTGEKAQALTGAACVGLTRVARWTSGRRDRAGSVGREEQQVCAQRPRADRSRLSPQVEESLVRFPALITCPRTTPRNM
eukprot:3909824-Rhodomonas_salina.4